ncbi:TRAP transporter small permease [Psychrobacillus lasiicapitis]|uniref:TRAP transporter small permease n=1 Tax=Psychrobacillus lasiicapitis TaxID=1636719 RepID=A0A544T380_9BACI|nr:TRAP transporter small permease [Psychrobacillus lasiicapitis]TQR11909.1 TRAP transporter small permease [Psychrobacillus lasiicapitis]GGA20382.1 ATP-independent transporter subunit [Psychrobacillus lasiicapitis]
MGKVKRIMDKVLSAACAALLSFMTLLATYQVISRYVFSSPSTMSEDLLSYSFVWVSLLGTALVFGQKDHMNLSILSDRLVGVNKFVLSIFTELLIMFIAIIVFLFGGTQVVGVGAIQISPTLNISMDWIYIVLPISGVLIVIYNCINIIQLIQQFNESKKEGIL